MGKSLSRNRRNHASSAAKSVTGKETVRKIVPEVEILELVGADVIAQVPKLKRIDQHQETKSSIVRCTRELLGVGVAVGCAQHLDILPLTRESNSFVKMATVNRVREIARRVDASQKLKEHAEEAKMGEVVVRTILATNFSAREPNCVFQLRWKPF